MVNENKNKLEPIIREAADFLEKKAVDEPLKEARLLMQGLLQITVAEQLAKPDKPLNLAKQKQFWQALRKRAKGMPIAYIIGKADFYGRDFSVENTLIPRPETELLIEAVLKLKFASKTVKILDLCTGSGCIGITLFLELCNKYQIELDLSDISYKALKTCQKNVNRFIKNQASVRFCEVDLFPKTAKNYDLIIANPPYIQTSTLETLQMEVKEYEPTLALDGGRDGLIFYRRIAKEIQPFLSTEKATYLFLEHGLGQRAGIKEIFAQSNLTITETTEIDDWQKIDRILGFMIKG